MNRAKPIGWHTVTPRIVTADPERLVGFLRDAFGATGDYRSDVPSVMRIGDSNLMISAPGPRDAASAFLYLYVDDADETYRRAIAAGATTLEEPADMPYGDRRAMVRDPCGNDWQIATHLNAADSSRNV